MTLRSSREQEEKPVVILVQKSRRPRRWAGVALLAGALGVVLWVEHCEHAAVPVDGAAPASPREAHADAAATTPLAGSGTAFSADPLVTHPPAAVGPPEGMTAEQWRALRDSLKDHPQRDAEIARIADYMAFRARAERYRALRDQKDSPTQAEARQLATGLLDTLPAHVARGELSAGEARLMQQALLETLLPNGAQRETRQAVERQRLADALPAAPDLAGTNERNARFLREQSALVAAWQARPAAQRDPQQLEASIAALRQSIFDPQRKGGQP